MHEDVLIHPVDVEHWRAEKKMDFQYTFAVSKKVNHCFMVLIPGYENSVGFFCW